MDAALKALAEPRRREILRLVWTEERPAGEIASHFSVSRPAISQHLRVLKECNLLAERRVGTSRLYRARPDTVAELRRFLDDYWSNGLERLRDAAEAAERSDHHHPEPTDRRRAEQPRPNQEKRSHG